METTDVLLTEGPLDGERYAAENTGLVEILRDGLIHRYIPTTKSGGSSGEQLPVYQYDGAVSPDGGMPGAENPQERLASPLADELRGDNG